jgi:hypothetical protein
MIYDGGGGGSGGGGGGGPLSYKILRPDDLAEFPRLRLPKNFADVKLEIRKRYSLFVSPRSKTTTAVTPDPTANIVGIGFGRKWQKKAPTATAALLVFVKRKFEKNKVEPAHRLPAEVLGIPTDVIETGEFQLLAKAAANPRGRWRPHAPGCSIGPETSDGAAPIAGTFGAVVRDRKNKQLNLLSAAHVLTNFGASPRAGSTIYQPSLLDFGTRSDQAGQLARWELWTKNSDVTLDAGIAVLADPKGAVNQIPVIGAITGVGALRVDDTVEKFGRNTKHTIGIVQSINADIDVTIANQTISFFGQTLIQGLVPPFADASDSGALVVESSKKAAVGLLVGGNLVIQGHFGLVTPIQPILDALEVDLV